MVVLTEQIIKGKTRLDKLEEVRNLNLWGQDLDDCTILAKLPNLEVLSLSVNRLSSLKDFRHCNKLQELYLRKNDVRDLSELQHLVPLKELRVLWLSDNPCAEQPGYKQYVARLLPHLQKLDNDDLASINLDAGPPPAPSLDARVSGGAPPNSPFDSPNMDRPQSRGSGVLLQLDRPQSRGSGFPSPPDQPQNGTPAGYGPRQGGAAGERAAMLNGGAEGGFGGSGAGVRNTKNILYAVMALLGELEDEDLVYVRREIEQRMGNRM